MERIISVNANNTTLVSKVFLDPDFTVRGVLPEDIAPETIPYAACRELAKNRALCEVLVSVSYRQRLRTGRSGNRGRRFAVELSARKLGFAGGTATVRVLVTGAGVAVRQVVLPAPGDSTDPGHCTVVREEASRGDKHSHKIIESTRVTVL